MVGAKVTDAPAGQQRVSSRFAEGSQLVITGFLAPFGIEGTDGVTLTLATGVVSVWPRILHSSSSFGFNELISRDDPCSGGNALVQEQLCSNCATTETRPVLQDCFALTGGPYGEKHKPIFDAFFGSGALAE